MTTSQVLVANDLRKLRICPQPSQLHAFHRRTQQSLLIPKRHISASTSMANRTWSSQRSRTCYAPSFRS